MFRKLTKARITLVFLGLIAAIGVGHIAAAIGTGEFVVYASSKQSLSIGDLGFAGSAAVYAAISAVMTCLVAGCYFFVRWYRLYMSDVESSFSAHDYVVRAGMAFAIAEIMMLACDSLSSEVFVLTGDLADGSMVNLASFGSTPLFLCAMIVVAVGKTLKRADEIKGENELMV